MNELKNNIQKIHTTELGKIRIIKNLELKTNDVVNWCKNEIKKSENIIDLFDNPLFLLFFKIDYSTNERHSQ